MYYLRVLQKRSEKRTRDRMLRDKSIFDKNSLAIYKYHPNSPSCLHDRNSYHFDSVSNFLQHDDNIIVQQEKTNGESQLYLHPLIRRGWG